MWTFGFFVVLIYLIQYREAKKASWARNMLLLKNPQFLPNFFGTWLKWCTNGLVILTKCPYDWVKIVDFLLKAYLWAKCHFCFQTLYHKSWYITHLKKIVKIISKNLKSSKWYFWRKNLNFFLLRKFQRKTSYNFSNT